MKTDEQRGAVGRWLRQSRLERKWKAEEAFKRLAPKLHVSPSLYAHWEAGSRQPNEAQLAALKDFYGSAPEERSDAGVVTDSGIPALVEQLRGQNATMSDAIGYLMRTAAERERQTEELVGLAKIQQKQTNAIESLARVQQAQTDALTALVGEIRAMRLSGAPGALVPEDLEKIVGLVAGTLEAETVDVRESAGSGRERRMVARRGGSGAPA